MSHIRSAICYSRDHLAGPLRALDGLLKDLRSGFFNPDCTRSGYFNDSDSAKQTCDVIEVEPSPTAEVKPEPQVLDGGEILDESDNPYDTGSSSDESGAETGPSSKLVNPPRVPEGCKLFQHAKSKMLRLMLNQNSKVFLCGRSAGGKHVVSTEAQLRWDTPCCNGCWRAARRP